jgi:hypothetical protein
MPGSRIGPGIISPSGHLLKTVANNQQENPARLAKKKDCCFKNTDYL